MKANLYKILFGVVIGIAIMFFFRGCGGPDTPIIGTTVKTVHHTDTVYSHHTDTVFVEGPAKYVYLDAPTEINDDYMVHSYEEEDLVATVTTYADDSQEIDYSVICPEITHTDTITITNTDSIIVTNTIAAETKNKLFLGSSIAIADKEVDGVSMNLTWQLKNDFQVYYEYGAMFNTNDQHRFGVKIPLRRK